MVEGVSHDCEESISWLKSNWQAGQDFRLQKVIVRYVGIDADHSAFTVSHIVWLGDSLMFSVYNY